MEDLLARDDYALASSKRRVRAIQAFVTVCLFLCILFAALRIYVRLRIIRSFRIDDWVMLITIFFMICSGILSVVATAYGLGSHMSVLSESEKIFILVLIWVASAGYLCTVVVLKSAFLLQYRRVFPLPTFQRICDLFLGFLGLWLLAGLITNFIICQPLHNYWDPRLAENGQSCRARYDFWLANGIIHLVTDVVVFVMPLPIIQSLRLSMVHKLVLTGVFSLGFLTCVISGIRLTTLDGALLGTDPSWSMSTTLFWSLSEATCAILCLCVPTLRPLLSHRKQLLSRSRQTDDVQDQQTPEPVSLALSEADVGVYHAALRDTDTRPLRVVRI